MSTTPSTTGYADVNGLHLYYETYGSGAPLVLLHGGMLTIDLNFASLIPTLAQTHTVIGVEMQGHGRTANIDREITYANLATDIVALLDHLGIERAAVLGHSMGGGVALELAVNHPDRVSAIVPISASVEQGRDAPGSARPVNLRDLVDHAHRAGLRGLQGRVRAPVSAPGAVRRVPHVASGMDSDFAGWTDEQLAGISCPVLIVQGDNDFTTVAHAGVMLAKIPNSTLAVIPATTHMQVTRRDTILLPVLEQFFAAHPGV